MRVVDRQREWIGYRLNILGVRVYRTHCRLSARRQHGWEPVGAPRALPMTFSEDEVNETEDPLLVTALQYERECPGSDLLDLLRGQKTFDDALRDSAAMTSG